LTGKEALDELERLLSTQSGHCRSTNLQWKLREPVRIVNQTLTELKLEKHPDKTYIGKIEKGFDFLGYRFEPRGLGLALGTLKRFKERITQLYEQGADEHRIGQYVRRFKGWAIPALPQVGGAEFDPFIPLEL
jgi:hypothetical protein